MQKTDGLEETQTHKENNLSNNRLGHIIKIIWVGLIGFAAWIMTSTSGIDGVKMLSNLGGFPALFIIIGLNIVLLKLSLKPALLKNIDST